jgi:hypothetical protein
VRGLLDKPETIAIGSAKYSLYLQPNVVNQMKSLIVLENTANEDEKTSITIKKLLEAVHATGEEVVLGDASQTYRAFYFDNIKDGKADPALKTFAFLMLQPTGDVQMFLVPSENVPENQVAVFKMYKDRKMGLQRAPKALKIYKTP